MNSISSILPMVPLFIGEVLKGQKSVKKGHPHAA